MHGFISTGRLPQAEEVGRLVREAYDAYVDCEEGQVSSVYPALARVPPSLFGISVVGSDGHEYIVGDGAHEFAMMSVSKPFVFALVAEALGAEEVRARVGANATGLPFNSLAAVEHAAGGRTNPMVNAGAIVTTSLVPGTTLEEKWDFLYGGLCRFAGMDLAMNTDVLSSALETNFRNRAIAALLRSLGALNCEADEAVELYTRQCSLNVTARSLAVMAATLACGGSNPLTREMVVSPEVCHYTLATMATAGLYETSGDWLFEVGLPGKSGIAGGLVTVSPGKGGLGVFSPPLDAAGNSVRGHLVARYLSQRLGMDLFISQPLQPLLVEGDA